MKMFLNFCREEEEVVDVRFRTVMELCLLKNVLFWVFLEIIVVNLEKDLKV